MAEGMNYYSLMGLSINATPEEIRRAYRDAALKLHPDTNIEAGATEFFLDVQEAYEVLSNASVRSIYDASLPVEVKQAPAINISTIYSTHCLNKLDQPQMLYVLLDLKAEEKLEDQPSPPLNIGLIIDSSTSMQGEAMDTVKSTAIELIRQLRNQDRLSIISFSDRAKVLLPASRNLDRKMAINAVQMLQPHGATEIYKGLEAGFGEVNLNCNPNYVNHLILLTDGRTYGDESNCYRLAERATAAGIVISTLGIGCKWNDAFLDTLAARTGGSCMYVSMPLDIRHFLKEKINILGKSYADRVIYNFTASPGVYLNYAMRITPDVSVLEPSSPLQLGSLPVGSRLSVLLELSIEKTPGSAQDFLLTEGKLTMDIPSRMVPKYSWELSIERPVKDNPKPHSPPFQIMQAVARMTLYRMQEKAQKDVAEGRFKEATRRLQHLATHLLENGEQELAHTVLEEVSHINEKRELSEEGKKRIKYGTRALLLPASVPDSDEFISIPQTNGEGG